MNAGTLTRRTRPGCTTLIAVAALTLPLTGCSGGSDEPEAADSPTDEASSVAAPPHLTGNTAPLAAGTYQLSFLADPGATVPDALVTIPDGFKQGEDGDDWYVESQSGQEFLGLWVVDTVDHDACLHEDADAFDPGPSVEQLADALAAQGSTRAAAPEAVTLDGHPGMFVEVTGPADLRKCDDFPALWRQPERGFYGDSQVDQVWILDVDGQRVVVDASYSPRSADDERDALTSMVESMQFVAAR